LSLEAKKALPLNIRLRFSKQHISKKYPRSACLADCAEDAVVMTKNTMKKPSPLKKNTAHYK